MSWLHLRGSQPVHVITSMDGAGPQAPALPSYPQRMRRYLLSMGIRTLCFVAAIFTHGWVQVAMVIAAIIVPYFAVLLANSDTRTRGVTSQARR